MWPVPVLLLIALAIFAIVLINVCHILFITSWVWLPSFLSVLPEILFDLTTYANSYDIITTTAQLQESYCSLGQHIPMGNQSMFIYPLVISH